VGTARTHHFPVAWLVGAVALAVSGCATNRPLHCDHEPILYVDRHYGFSTSEHRSGMIAAIWSDGRVVRIAQSADELESRGLSDLYQVGWLSADSLGSLVAELVASPQTTQLRQDCSADVAVLRSSNGEQKRIIECLPHQHGDLIPNLTRRILTTAMTGVDDVPDASSRSEHWAAWLDRR